MAITAQINVTPDGFCNHDDVVIDDDFMKFAVDIIEKAELLVLGRKTYELFNDHWPAAAKNPSLRKWEQNLGKAIDKTERIVISSTLSSSDWAGTTFWPTIDEERAATLQSGPDALVFGSPSIINQFLHRGILSTLLLSVHPVMGGSGTRLFDGLRTGRMEYHSDYETGRSVRTFEFRNPAHREESSR